MKSDTHTTTTSSAVNKPHAQSEQINDDENWQRFARWHGWLGLACSLCMILLYVIVIAIANACR